MLFLDVVDSTRLAASIGDVKWKRLIEEFYAAARSRVKTERGRVVKTTGDGILAILPGPASALDVASGLTTDAIALGMSVRSGVHLAEMEAVDDEDVGGLGVTVAARVVALASADAVLVTSTVREATQGSGQEFELFGERQLKGIPGTWTLWLYRGRT